MRYKQNKITRPFSSAPRRVLITVKMADLDAIWDDDAELASTSRPAVSDETRKSSEPLFIHGDESDAEMPDERDAPASGAADVELHQRDSTMGRLMGKERRRERRSGGGLSYWTKDG